MFKILKISNCPQCWKSENKIHYGKCLRCGLCWCHSECRLIYRFTSLVGIIEMYKLKINYGKFLRCDVFWCHHGYKLVLVCGLSHLLGYIYVAKWILLFEVEYLKL